MVEISQARRALEAFPAVPDGPVVAAEGGLINRTFMVGDGFVLQRLSPIFDAAVNEDIAALLPRLHAEGVPVPEIVPAADGRPYAVVEGAVWRVMTRLPGRSVHHLDRPALAREAAALVARFHGALVGARHDFAFVRPGAHDTPAHMARLQEALGRHRDHRLHAAVAPVAAGVLEAWGQWTPSAAVPRRIIHGDLKISNVLFDAQGRAVGLVDLDTMAWEGLDVELGDALRSWANAAPEDEAPRFEPAIVKAALEGYATASHPEIAAAEVAAAIAGFERIALELASRFALDALEERYFGWDPERAATRGEHNLARASGQLALARAIGAARPELEAWAASALE